MDLLWATSAGRKTQKKIEENGGVIEIEVKREEESHAKGGEREREAKEKKMKKSVMFPVVHKRKMFYCRERKRMLRLAEYRDRRNRVLVDGDAARPFFRSPCRNPKNRFE